MQYIVPIVGVAGMGALGLFAGVGAVDTYEKVRAQPKAYSLVLDQLKYDNGKICQKFIIANATDGVGAEWTAVVKRPGKSNPLCAGRGVSIYETEYSLKCFTPTQWTGDNCPDLQSGDKAYGEWAYVNSHGFTVRTTGSTAVP